MNFLAGAMMGSSTAFLVVLLMISGSFNGVAKRLEWLEATVREFQKRDPRDEADWWKSGAGEEEDGPDDY
jgi:hypothetical protein